MLTLRGEHFYLSPTTNVILDTWFMPFAARLVFSAPAAAAPSGMVRGRNRPIRCGYGSASARGAVPAGHAERRSEFETCVGRTLRRAGPIQFRAALLRAILQNFLQLK